MFILRALQLSVFGALRSIPARKKKRRHHTRAEGTSTSAVQHGIYRAWLTACSATWERVRDIQSSPFSLFFSFFSFNQCQHPLFFFLFFSRRDSPTRREVGHVSPPSRRAMRTATASANIACLGCFMCFPLSLSHSFLLLRPFRTREI